MAIIDDYAAIASATARLRGERAASDDKVAVLQRQVGRDSLIVEHGQVCLFPHRTAVQVRSAVIR